MIGIRLALGATIVLHVAPQDVRPFPEDAVLRAGERMEDGI